MKKILIVGKLNSALQEMSKYLARSFQVQISSEVTDTVEGMIKIINPDMILISLIGMHDLSGSLFFMLSNKYSMLPVLTIGTKEECHYYVKYYRETQFKNLIRPVDRQIVFEECCKRLSLDPAMLPVVEETEDGGTRKHVLIVDDDATTLRSIKAMLEDRYDISVAISGAKAITVIGKKRPDVILLDYEMPVCDGKMTLEMIRQDEDFKDIPVIFLTGLGDKEHITAVLSLKPAAYLLKPAVRGKLIEAIEKATAGNP